MSHCPIIEDQEIEKKISDFLHRKIDAWGTGQIVNLEQNVQWNIPSRLQIDGVVFEEVDVPNLNWCEGPKAQVAGGGKATHFHTELPIGTNEFHVDYFNFVTWGPLHGFEGFIVSRDCEVVCVGGHWGCPPAGGRRNWPLGLRIGSIVLTAFPPTREADFVDLSRSVVLWKKLLGQRKLHNPSLQIPAHLHNPSRRALSRFPKPFFTNWHDGGSRTADCGHRFEVKVDQDGFSITKKGRTDSKEELFDELGYWPEKGVWAGSAETLAELLSRLAKATHVSRKKLLEPIVFELEECRGLEITTYLAGEKEVSGKSENLPQFRVAWSALYGSYRIPGLPSPRNPFGDHVDGLELDFSNAGWTARHFSDAAAENCPEFFIPQVWTSETFDGLFEATDAWGTQVNDDCHFLSTQDELAQTLIKADPRWRLLIECGKIKREEPA